MTPSSRAFDCAWALAADHTERLTPEQFISCVVNVMRGPERADPTIIALAAQIIGQRQ